MNQIVNLIVGMLASGALSYINYSGLVSRGLISSFENEIDKRSTIIIYSIIDLSIYLIVNFLVSKYIADILLNISVSIFVALSIAFLFMKYLAPLLYGKMLSKTNMYRNEKKLTSQMIYTPREKVFERDLNMKVYMFDFSGI